MIVGLWWEVGWCDRRGCGDKWGLCDLALCGFLSNEIGQYLF